jgi:hypothetical protein
MALVKIRTLFLVRQKVPGRRQWSMLSVNDLVMVLAHMLPQRQLTAEELAEIIFISGIILNSLPSDGKWLWNNLTK